MRIASILHTHTHLHRGVRVHTHLVISVRQIARASVPCGLIEYIPPMMVEHMCVVAAAVVAAATRNRFVSMSVRTHQLLSHLIESAFFPDTDGFCSHTAHTFDDPKTILLRLQCARRRCRATSQLRVLTDWTQNAYAETPAYAPASAYIYRNCEIIDYAQNRSAQNDIKKATLQFNKLSPQNKKEKHMQEKRELLHRPPPPFICHNSSVLCLMAPVNNVRGTPSLTTVHLCASLRSHSFSRARVATAATAAIHPRRRAGRSFTPFICAFFRVYIYIHTHTHTQPIQMNN